MPDPSPQQLVLVGIRALDTMTASVRAVEKELDDLASEVRTHSTYMRGMMPDVLSRLTALETQVRRCEDRADQELTEHRQARGKAVSLLVSVARSPEARMLVTALVLAVAAYLGVQGQIATMLPHGGTP